MTVEKSIFNNSIDRKVYNVEKDLLAQTSSASEILQNIPSIDVDVNGTVNLRGTSNITFFINGKPSALMRANSAAALQQIPANTIERIEVITNPSAKFKPDGVGGIINIVLKKNTQQGFNGTFIGNVGTDERFNANLTLNYNTGKANVFGSYGIRQTNRTRTREELRISKDSIGQVLKNYYNISSAFVKPFSHVFNAGWDYTIDDKNSIGVTGTYYFQNAYQNFSSSTIFKDVTDTKTSAFESTRINDEFEKEYEGGISFEHQFEKEDHSLGLEFNFSGYDEKEDNVYNDNFTFPNITSSRIRNLIEKTGTVYQTVAAYTLPVAENIELEAGYEGEFVKDDIRFLGEIFNASNETWREDANRTNQFIFNQNVHAAYVTYGQSIKEISFLAGLRAEQVLMNSNLVTTNLQIPNNYFKVYPTLHLEYKMSDAASMQLNYSRRVNRADSDEQNPFGEYRDPRNKEAGNPKLKPEQVHSVEIGYHLTTEQFSFLPTLYYRYKYDAFTEIQTIIEDTVLLIFRAKQKEQLL